MLYSIKNREGLGVLEELGSPRNQLWEKYDYKTNWVTRIFTMI